MPVLSGNTKWNKIAALIKSTIKSRFPNYKAEIIEGGASYISGAVGQTILDNVTILIAPSENGSEERTPLLSNNFLKTYNFDIYIVIKSDPKLQDRMYGGKSDSIFTVRDNLEVLLDHNNFGNQVDNKAGTSFPVAWVPLPSDNKSFNIYHTTYIIQKTERNP